MSSKLMDLVQELTKVDDRLAKDKALRCELAIEVCNLLRVVPVTTPVDAAPVAKAPKSKAPKPKAPKATDNTTATATETSTKRTQQSLKRVVQSIVAQHPNGVELREIVNEVTGMVGRQEYFTKAQSITAIVSQALNQLTQDNAIVGERSPETKRNKYKTVAVAA